MQGGGRAREERSGLLGAPLPPPFFQDDVNKERKAVTNAAGATTRLPIHLSVVFRFKSDQSSQQEGGGGCWD